MHQQSDNTADVMNEPIIQADLSETFLAELAEKKSAFESAPNGTSEPNQRTKRRGIWGWIVAAWRMFKSMTEWIFGLFCLLIILSVLATIPVLQYLSLGYLLESAARIARPGGRFRDGFIGVRTAARMGGATLGTWILLQPLRLIGSLRRDAALFTGFAESQPIWNGIYALLLTLLLGQISWALYRGGRLRSFFWPAPLRMLRGIRRSGIAGLGRVYVNARDRVYDFAVNLKLPYYFMLGLKGFAVALAWMFLPVSVLVLSTQMPNEVLALLLAFVGGLMLAFVLLYLPFMQVNFAISGQFRDGFDRKRVRQQFLRAPIAFWMALLITLLFAVPLYLLKAELIPREAAWLPSFVFVLSILPARLLTGWAVRRSERREQPRHFIFRWLARLSALPVVSIYAFIVYMTQYVSWYGALSLYEQHAFLLPVPFLGL